MVGGHDDTVLADASAARVRRRLELECNRLPEEEAERLELLAERVEPASFGLGLLPGVELTRMEGSGALAVLVKALVPKGEKRLGLARSGTEHFFVPADLIGRPTCRDLLVGDGGSLGQKGVEVRHLKISRFVTI